MVHNVYIAVVIAKLMDAYKATYDTVSEGLSSSILFEVLSILTLNDDIMIQDVSLFC